MIDYPFSTLNEKEKENLKSKYSSNSNVKLKIENVIKNDPIEDPKEISLKLRNDLIEIYKKSFQN